MAISNRIKDLLNRALPIFTEITFGNVLQQMQSDIATLQEGGGGGGGSSATTFVVFDPDIATSTATNKKTMTEIQAVIDAAPGGVELGIKKAGVAQTAVAEDGDWDFTKVQRIHATVDSPAVILQFSEGSTIEFNLVVTLTGVNLVYTGTSQPLITVSTLLIVILEYAAVRTGSGAAASALHVAAGAVCYMHSEGESAILGRGDYEPVESFGTFVLQIWNKAFSAFYNSPNLFRNNLDDSTGTVEVFNYTIHQAYNQQTGHENYYNSGETGPISYTARSEARVNSLIQARNLTANIQTPSRSLDTIYTNGAKPLVVTVTCQMPFNASGQASIANLLTGGTVLASIKPAAITLTGYEANGSAAPLMSMMGVIPPGANYRVTTTGSTGNPPVLVGWIEQEFGIG